MAKRLKIGIDVDDVVIDFMEAFRKEAQTITGRELQGPPGSWDFANWGLTAEEEEAIWKHIYNTPNWFRECCCSPVEGVQELLPELCTNHEVYFITARREGIGEWSTQTQTAFTLESLGVIYPQVIVRKNKGQIVAALGLDIFIDDKPENLEDIHRWSNKTDLFIMNQSHNQKPVFEHWWYRVFSFTQFVREVEEIANS